MQLNTYNLYYTVKVIKTSACLFFYKAQMLKVNYKLIFFAVMDVKRAFGILIFRDSLVTLIFLELQSIFLLSYFSFFLSVFKKG